MFPMSWFRPLGPDRCGTLRNLGFARQVNAFVGRIARQAFALPPPFGPLLALAIAVQLLEVSRFKLSLAALANHGLAL